MNLKVCTTLAALILTISGTIWGATTYFATNEHVSRVEQRLEQKIVQDRISFLQQRIWEIEDRFAKDGQFDINTVPLDIKNQYRQLKRDLEIETINLKK